MDTTANFAMKTSRFPLRLLLVALLAATAAPAIARDAALPQAGVETRTGDLKPGHETPTGTYPILEKRRRHFSNLYNNAPMPFMQRLTWDGIALHAGQIPGYPASHGCVRLPHAFAEKLFAITERDMMVVIADETSHSLAVVHPGDRIPVNPVTGLEPAGRADALAGTASGVDLERTAAR